MKIEICKMLVIILLLVVLCAVRNISAVSLSKKTEKKVFYREAMSTRGILAIMICLACIIFSIFRSSMSIIILAMTERPHNASIPLPDYGIRYPWSAYEQSLVMGAYFWGNTVICAIAGVLSERYGSRAILGFSFGIAAILSAVSSVAAQSLWLTIFIRFCSGVMMGTVVPCCQTLIANWVPSGEKGKFLSLLTFNGIGAVINWPMSGYIIEQYGWKYVFYVIAVILGLFAVLCLVTIYDNPSQHPRISLEERDLILSKLSTSRTGKKPWPPIRSIFQSIPFLTLLIFNFGDMCGFYFLLTSVPRYLSEVHEFNITSIGLLASIPYLTRVPFGLMFGYVNDQLYKRKIMSTTAIRKTFSLCSHFIPGCFLIGIHFVRDQPYTCLAFITIALCFNSAIAITSMHNGHDLAPNFASTIYGIISFFGTLPGYLAPLLVAHFTKDKSTADEWQKVFYAGGLIFIATNILFLLFGSGTVQKWNHIPNERVPDGTVDSSLIVKTEANEMHKL